MGGRPGHGVMKFRVTKLKGMNDPSQMSREVKQKQWKDMMYFKATAGKPWVWRAVPTWLFPCLLPPHPTAHLHLSSLFAVTLMLTHTMSSRSSFFMSFSSTWSAGTIRARVFVGLGHFCFPSTLDGGGHTLHTQRQEQGE